jgi:polygalacturonase
VDGLTIIQPQFWATFVSYSKNVSITNLFVNATSDDQWGTVNTDGYDSWNSVRCLSKTQWSLTRTIELQSRATLPTL